MSATNNTTGASNGIDVIGIGEESNQEGKHDCHNVVKSSGLSGKKRFCCEHGHKCSKVLKISVACQTDSTEDDLEWKLNQQDSSNDEIPNGSAAEQQTVAHELCPVKDDDGSKPEGTLRLMIHNFRNMNDTVRGPAKLVSGVPWKIMVMPRQHVVAKKGTQKCLGFFLQCCPESYSDSWLCQAAAELRLIAQKPGVPNFVRKTNHIYTAKENDWGYSCFMTWADILDESQGYMKDESVILEVFVKAEPPKGILTHDAFCKKIQDYMRLADMQCSRNLIDKALEVNQTALKFCKDKDELMKDELEKQKNRLIERKLKQSIERIEKDSKQLDSVEGSTNLNNLRQALAGNLAAFKTAANAKTATTPTTNATPPTTTTTQTKEKSSKQASNNNNVTMKDSTNVTTPMTKSGSTNNAYNEDAVRRSSADLNKDQSLENVDQGDVKSVVDNLVSSLSKDEGLSMHQLKSAMNAGVLSILEDDPCCSDQSDDDDSDYEDIDEVCDTCLEEKLDHMSGATPVVVEAQDMSCQTDFQPLQSTKLRLTPVGAVNAPPPPPTAVQQKTTAIVNESAAVVPVVLDSGNTTNLSTQAIVAATVVSAAKKEQQNNQVNNQTRSSNAAKQPTPTVVDQQQQQLVKTTTTVPLTTENEHKLLKLITEESKASLNSIKDTLERLVSLAQGGDSPSQAAPLPFDLNQLPTHHPLNKQTAVRTDIIDIPLPTSPAVVPPTGQQTGGGVLMSAVPPPAANVKVTATATLTPQQQQQQQVDMNQQMAQIKQIIEFKRRHQSPSFIDDENGDVQRQQFVQTDLSYQQRAASPITEEDYTLLRHAKEIVENKAEELVSRYSQLIEQSEANRLAETVKKVEKRMKDIEKQTMTCRKELSDECERHHREEQKLIKSNKQLKQQLDQANEKVEKLNAQLKERRAEIKKLEKKLKVECQTSAENAELNAKIEQLERDLQTAKQKHLEEKQKYTEENQKLMEIKKNLQQELSCATNEMERLHAQIDEKGNQMRKVESNFKQDRQQAQTALKEASERAKKAEMNLLEFKLEISVKTLQRSLEDCQVHISQLEEFTKKCARNQPVDDMKWLGTYVQDWHKTKEKIQDLLQKTKTEFSQQVEAVKAGKPLSSLPVLDMPKPPATPQTPKQFLLMNQPQEQKQPIAPIGVHPTSTGGGPMKTRSFSPNVMTNGTVQTRINSGTSATNNSNSSGATVVTSNAQSAYNQQQSLSSSGGTTPDVGNGVEFNSSAFVVQQQQQPQQQSQPASQVMSSSGNVVSSSSTASAVSNSSTSAASAMATGVGQRNDFTLWSDPLQGLTQSLFGSKAFTGVAGFDGFGSQAGGGAMVGNGPYHHQQQSQHHQQQHVPPPPPTASQQQLSNKINSSSIGSVPAGGQWSSWGYQQMFNNRGQQQPPPQQPPPHHSASEHSLMNGPDSRSINYIRSASRTQIDGTSPQPFQSFESSMDSPISSDKSKQVDAVAEQLRILYPNLSPEMIRDFIHEFRSMQYNRSLKGLTGEQVFNGVAAIIYPRQKQQQQGSWSNNMSSMNNAYDIANEMAMTAATMAQYASSGTAYNDMCTMCGHDLRGSEVYTLACNHTFHSACITPWLSNQPNCPVCCAYTVPPEEYPDLA